jgi:hypothetical protein
MPNKAEDNPPAEFERFKDLTKGLLKVSKEELDEARRAEAEAPRGPSPNRSRSALN